MPRYSFAYIRMPILFMMTALSLSACGDDRNGSSFNASPSNSYVGNDTIDVIAYCNAGVGIKKDSNLDVRLSILTNGAGAGLSYSKREEIKGLFLNSGFATGKDAINLYERYIGCVDRRTAAKQCESACVRQFDERITVHENHFRQCILKRRNSCYKECVYKHGISRGRCRDTLCRVDSQNNIDNWTPKCRLPRSPAQADRSRCISAC